MVEVSNSEVKMGIAYTQKRLSVRGLAGSISWTYSYLAGQRDANVSPKAICSVSKSFIYRDKANLRRRTAAPF